MKGKLALKLVVVLKGFDIVFTLRYWHREGNPIVIILGKVPFVVVNVFFTFALVFVWLKLRGYKIRRLVDLIVWLFVGLMIGATLHNITSVTGIGF